MRSPWPRLGCAGSRRAARPGQGTRRSRRRGRGGRARPGAPAPAQRRRVARPAALPGGGRARAEWTQWFVPLAADGRASFARRVLGGRPSAAPRAEALGTDDDAAGGLRRRAPATGRPGDRRGPGDRRDVAERARRGGTPDGGAGPDHAGPPGGKGLGHRAARRPVVRRATCWSACTAPAAAGAAAWSTRCRSRSTSASSPTGSMRRPTAGSKGRAGLLEVLEQLQGIERPQPNGKPRSCPPTCPGTTPAGSTSCASPANRLGQSHTTRRSGPAAAGTPSPATTAHRFVLVTTSRTCCEAVARARRRPSPRSAPPPRAGGPAPRGLFPA